MAEDTADVGFFQPTPRGSERIIRRTSIADRQATAQKFLFEAADEVYDGDLDIDWAAPVNRDLGWLPMRSVSLYGTESWDRLTSAQRLELSRHELVNVLTLMTYAHTVLAMLTFRQIAEEGDLVDDRARWLLKCVNTRTSSVTMFGRLIEITGLGPRMRPRMTRRLERLTLLVPSGAVTATLVLLLESMTRNMIAVAADDSTVQPHVGQILTVTALSSRRHVEFAHAELAAAVEHRGPVLRSTCSLVAAALMAFVGRLLVDDESYRAAGVTVPASVRSDVSLSAPFRDRMTGAFGDTVRMGSAVGLFSDPFSRAVLRRGRVVRPLRVDRYPTSKP